MHACPSDQLLLLRRDIESEILELAELSGLVKKGEERHFSISRLVDSLLHRKVLSTALARTVLFVYRECSRAVHGRVLSDKDASLVRELGVKTLITLRRIVEQHTNR